MINYSVENDSDHLVLFLDYKKAFDSVSHQFLDKLLLHIRLPESYVQWICIICGGAKTVIRH